MTNKEMVEVPTEKSVRILMTNEISEQHLDTLSILHVEYSITELGICVKY